MAAEGRMLPPFLPWFDLVVGPQSLRLFVGLCASGSLGQPQGLRPYGYTLAATGFSCHHY